MDLFDFANENIVVGIPVTQDITSFQIRLKILKAKRFDVMIFHTVLSGAMVAPCAIFAISYNDNTMSKRQVLMVVGLLILVVTFLGLPWGIKQILIVAGAVLVVGIAYSMAAKAKPAREADMPWSEHRSPSAPIISPTSNEQK
jgi:hypothetical protein